MDRGSPWGAGPGGPPGPGGGGPPRWPGDPLRGRGPAEESDASSLVRPYAVTGGRTRPRYDLAVEALVTAAPYPPRDVAGLTPEYRAIMDLCRSARSVAEVSALLKIPLGVARVLIADQERIQRWEEAGGGPEVRVVGVRLDGPHSPAVTPWGAIADRAGWRADERRWVREGRLPRPGWWPEGAA